MEANLSHHTNVTTATSWVRAVHARQTNRVEPYSDYPGAPLSEFITKGYFIPCVAWAGFSLLVKSPRLLHVPETAHFRICLPRAIAVACCGLAGTQRNDKKKLMFMSSLFNLRVWLFAPHGKHQFYDILLVCWSLAAGFEAPMLYTAMEYHGVILFSRYTMAAEFVK